MAYKLNQLNFKETKYNYTPEITGSSRVYSDPFLTPIVECQCNRMKTGNSSGVSVVQDVLFWNDFIALTGKDEQDNAVKFKPGECYYYHGRIKRLESIQVIYIKLINIASSGQDSVTQYIKTIQVSGGNEISGTDWADLEFTFTPYIAFDAILFELQRTSEDYKDKTRYTLMVHEELCSINNILENNSLMPIGSDTKLIKMGVQSRPGLLMSINGEEIRTCRTGIFELRSGEVAVETFSILSAATNSATNAKIAELDEQWRTYYGKTHKSEEDYPVHSACLVDSLTSRTISSFTMDYMYRQTT